MNNIDRLPQPKAKRSTEDGRISMHRAFCTKCRYMKARADDGTLRTVLHMCEECGKQMRKMEHD